jgi:hypothetical protein
MRAAAAVLNSHGAGFLDCLSLAFTFGSFEPESLFLDGSTLAKAHDEI